MRERLSISAVAVLATVAGLVIAPNVIAGSLGTVVAKNTANHGRSKVAVAINPNIVNPGSLTMRVTTRPKHLKTAWIYTARCIKDGRFYQYPAPGDAHDTNGVTPLTIPMKLGGVVNPDACNVAASAKLDYHVGKSVSVKIFSQPARNK